MRDIIIGAVLAALLGGAAVAQDEPAQTGLTEGHLDAADTTGDEAVSLDEFRAYVKSAFDALDADASGAVSWTEAEGKILRTQFDGIDVDGNGSVSASEMDRQAQTDFAASDRNGDGALN